jgi:hypothetical protein
LKARAGVRARLGADLTREELLTWFNAQPFRPFDIFLAGGRKVPVRHREFLNIQAGGRTIHVHQPYESLNVIDLLLVTDLEFKKTEP